MRVEGYEKEETEEKFNSTATNNASEMELIAVKYNGSSFLQQKNDGAFTPERCQTLPAASVDTILWGGGEGDQGENFV